MEVLDRLTTEELRHCLEMPHLIWEVVMMKVQEVMVAIEEDRLTRMGW